MYASYEKAHAHQCGRVSWGMLPDYGCGTVFIHRRNYAKTEAADHMCPACGLGPWYVRVAQPTIHEEFAAAG